MSFRDNFFNIFKTVNPYNYIELSGIRISAALRYFFFLVVFCISILFVVSIPYLYNTADYVSKGIGHFDALSLSQSFQVKDSLNLLADPLVRVTSSNNTNSSDEVVLITPEKIVYKKYLFFGGMRSLDINNGLDFVNSPQARSVLVAGIFFILPSILFWAIVFWLAYFLAVIIFTYILVMMAAGSLRIDASAVHLFKMTMYSSTLLILSQILLLPFYRNMLLPIILYWVFIMVVLFLWYDNPPGRGARSANPNVQSQSSGSSFNSGSRNKSIFDDDDSPKKSIFSSSKNSSKKIPAADSYDVDENGNVRSSAKRRKSFNDDNDGYVEL